MKKIIELWIENSKNGKYQGLLFTSKKESFLLIHDYLVSICGAKKITKRRNEFIFDLGNKKTFRLLLRAHKVDHMNYLGHGYDFMCFENMANLVDLEQMRLLNRSLEDSKRVFISIET